MANPPPVRPWSRLASLRPVPPKPSPQTQPSPVQKVPAPSASLPNSPSPKASQAPNTSTIDNNANATATKSPQGTKPAVETKMQSQNSKLNTPPPSPLALPPSHLKVNTEENKGKGIHKKLSNSEDSGTRVITISGENRGAYMEITQSSKKPNFLHKKGNSKIKGYDYESENSGSSDGNASRKNKNHRERTPLYSPPMSAYMNSNVQCVNNSLLYGTSCTSNDPGVQLILPRKPSGEGFHQRERVDGKNN